jgi:phosphoribosylglycinamide formyltransferase-1
VETYQAPRPYAPLPARLVVLLSGRGSNFEVLADACEAGEIPARIAGVITDRADAVGIRRAEARGFPAVVNERRKGERREEHEERLGRYLEGLRPDLICLAGYMRVLSADLVSRHALRIVNIHPSLLPAFPGLHAQRQALEYGCRMTGATVHFVDIGVDSGPILGQEAVQIEDGDTEGSLAARVLEAEHRLYPACVRRVLAGGWTLTGRSVSFSGANASEKSHFRGIEAGERGR